MPRGYPSAAKKASKKRAVIEAEDGEDDIIGGTVIAVEEETPADVHPVCPIDGGFLGDKAEAVVDWWYENHPELAAVKYHRRKTHRS